MIWFTNYERAGLLPGFFDILDPRSAREQLQEAYGVSPFKGFTLHDWQKVGGAFLTYTGDPPMREASRATLRDETLILFECDWFAIVQPDGTHIITRCD